MTTLLMFSRIAPTGFSSRTGGPFPEEGGIVEDGSEEDGERDHDFHDVLHVPEEKIRAGQQHPERGREE